MVIFMFWHQKQIYDSLYHNGTLSNVNDLYNNEQISGNDDDLMTQLILNMSFYYKHVMIMRIFLYKWYKISTYTLHE